jgi:outer membrane receptor protein involved in Fe transport
MTVFSGSLNFRLDYSWTDEYFMEAANDPFLLQDSFNVLNGAITWTSQSEQWELALQGLNITDEWYMTSPQASFINSGYVAPTVARPAQYSLRGTFSF